MPLPTVLRGPKSRKRLLATTAVLGLVTCCAWLAWRLHGMDYQTSVRLPYATEGEVHDASGWLQVDLTRHGEILYRREAVTLDALARRVGEHPARPLLLCIDRDASYLNVLYLFDVLAERHRGTWWIAVDDGWRKAALPVRYALVGGWGCVGMGIRVVRAPDQGVARLADCEFLAGDGAPVTSADLTRALRAARRATEDFLDREEMDDEEVTGQITAPTTIPLQAFVAALDAFRAVGVTHVGFGWLRVHPWIRTQRPLPVPDWGFVIPAWAFPPVTSPEPVALPLAPAATPDDGWGGYFDRITINLDAGGRLLARGRQRSLEELTSYLKDAERRLAMLEPIPREDEAHSRLPVLLRIDRDAPWQHVLWVVAVLRELRIDKVEVAAKHEPDASFGAREVAVFGLPASRRVPFPPGWQDAALPLPRAPEADTAPLPLEVLPGREPAEVVVRLPGRAPVAGARVAELLAALPPDAQVELRAPPTMPHGRVVAVLSQLAGAGFSHVVFDAGAGPPATVRAASVLPAPAGR